MLAGVSRSGQRPPAMRGKEQLELGLLQPKRPGSGYRLEFENLSPAGRRATLSALCNMPLRCALERALGPAIEERPDVKAVRELAPPATELDERMGEMAGAVMTFWQDDDDLLPLDEEGVALVAAALSADMRAMADDDILACGAFIGEALRKRIGGQWTGFDGHYVLEVNGAVLDPIGWAFEVHAGRDVAEGTRMLLASYENALGKFAPPARRFIGTPVTPLEIPCGCCAPRRRNAYGGFAGRSAGAFVPIGA